MKKFLVILMGVLMIIGGVYCLLTPVSTFLTTGYIIGVITFCDAIGNIVAWFESKKYAEISVWYLVDAIISLIFGVIIMLNIGMQFAVDMFVVYLVAAWVIIVGVSRIMMAVRIKKFINALPKFFRNNKWVGILLFGILMVLFGILCMIKPILMSGVLGTFMALFIIFAGASLVTLGTYIHKEA